MSDSTYIAVGAVLSALIPFIVCYLMVPKVVAKVLPGVLTSLGRGGNYGRR